MGLLTGMIGWSSKHHWFLFPTAHQNEWDFLLKWRFRLADVFWLPKKRAKTHPNFFSPLLKSQANLNQNWTPTKKKQSKMFTAIDQPNLQIVFNTPPKINIEPENDGWEDEIQVPAVKLLGCNWAVHTYARCPKYISTVQRSWTNALRKCIKNISKHTEHTVYT